MRKEFLIGVAMMLGTSIGVGVFGIPYVIKSGFVSGLISIILLGLAFMFINLSLGETLLRTKGNHQLCGIMEIYLGKTGKWFMLASLTIGIYGALAAYVTGAGEVLSQMFGFSKVFWEIVFFAVGLSFVFGGFKRFAKSQLWSNITKLTVFVIIALILLLSSEFKTGNLSGFSNFFSSWGVILFAYICTSVIPVVKLELGKNLKLLKSVLIWASIIPIIVYAVFTIGIIGVSGNFTTDVATIGAAFAIGGIAGLLINLFAILAMLTAFPSLSFALSEVFILDFGFSKLWAMIATFSIPIVIILVGASFTGILEIAGAFSSGIAGISVLWAYLRARKHGQRKPEYSLNLQLWFVLLLMVIFLVGIWFGIKELFGF